MMSLRKLAFSLVIVAAAMATAQEVRFDESSGSINAGTAASSAAGSQVLTAGGGFDEVIAVATVTVDSGLQMVGMAVNSSPAAAGSNSNILCRLTAF